MRSWSSMAPKTDKQEEVSMQAQPFGLATDKDDEKAIVSSYWGIAPPKLSKDDGSPWRWNCFRVCMHSIIYTHNLSHLLFRWCLF